MGDKGIHNGGSSIGACDHYSNPYDMRMQSHPGLASQRQANYLKSQDTLSSAHLRLEKEIFLKMKEGGLNFPWGSFVVVGTIGKYVFLAFMLPPYMLCYGIPKWIVMQGLSKFHALTARLLRPISTRIAVVAHKFVNALKAFGASITSPILMYIQTRIEKVQKFYNQQIQRVIDILGYPARLFEKKIVAPVSALFGAINNRIQQAAAIYQNFEQKIHYIIQGFDKIKEYYARLERQFESLSSRLTKIQQSLAAFARNPFAMTGKNLKQSFKVSASRLVGLGQRFLSKIKRGSDRSAERFERFMKNLAEPTRKFFDPIMNAVQKRWDAIQNKTQKLSVRAIEAVDSSVKNIAAFGLNGIQMLSLPALSLFASVAASAASSFNYKKRTTLLKVFVKTAKDIIDSALREGAKWLFYAQGKAIKAIKKWIFKLKAVPEKLFGWFKALLWFFYEAFKGTFLIFSLMFAWIKALVRYGMLLAREATLEFLLKY